MLSPALLKEFAAEQGLTPNDLRDLAATLSTGPMYNKYVVGVEEFCNSPHYMNACGQEGASVLWPEVMRCIIEMNSGDYDEAVLTGGIGSAKTTAALYTIAYQLYLLTCLKNPHHLFGLDPSSEILIIFQNLTERLARGVDYQRFKAMIDAAPYFRNTPEAKYNRRVESELQFPHRIIVRPLSGQDTAAIGNNVIGGLIDEVNFMSVTQNSKRSRDGGTYNQAWAVYNSIDRRRKSRFLHGGSMPGILCLSSSRRYPGEFTDVKIEEAMTERAKYGRSSIYVYDKRVWEVKPQGTYSGEWFNVFTGDEARKPRVLREGEEIPDKDRPMMISVPLEFRRSFDIDLINALRDIAGVSTLSRFPFMLNVEAVAACFGQTEAIVSRDVVEFESEKLKIYPIRIVNPQAPRHVHIDFGLTSDSAGVSIAHVPGFKKMQRGDTVEMMPIIQYDVILEVRPPPNGEIQFHKIRSLIYALREAGMNIQWVTLDSYQSVDTMQTMRMKGFYAWLQSVDKTRVPYEILKFAVYDGRVIAPEHAKAQHELITLEDDPKTGKIDHPPNSCFTGETRVALADGTCPTFAELVAAYAPNEEFYVYSMGPEGVRITAASNPRITKTADELVEILLDNYQVIRCTPEHLFMSLDGDWVRAENLTPDIPIMPLYRSRAYKGGLADYERVWCPIRERRILTHHIAFGAMVPEGYHLHHKDENKTNNAPTNLEALTQAEHCRHHGVDRWEVRRAAMRAGHIKYYENGGREEQRAVMNRLYAEGILKKGREVCAVERCEALVDARGLCGMHYQRARRARLKAERTSRQKNHRVLSVTRVQAAEPVYDLTVPGTENFALASGVFVHNSKDCSDSMAGAAYGLTMRRDIWLSHGISLRDIPASLAVAIQKSGEQAEAQAPNRMEGAET